MKVAVELRMMSGTELGDLADDVGLVTDQLWLVEELFNFSGPLFPSKAQNSSHFVKGLRIK